MEFGPLTQTDLNRVRKLLQEHGSDCEVRKSEEAMREAEEARRQRAAVLTTHPTFSGPDAIYFVDIKNADLLIVRGLLEQMGCKVGSYEAEELPEVPEFLCVRCRHVALSAGLCPKHNEPLLAFSDWAEAKAQRENRRWRAMFIVLLVGIVFVMALQIFF